MGFLHVLRKMKERELEIRILILGLDNSGKTTLLKQLNGEDLTQISPTIGFNIKTLDYKGYSLNLWDIGGQKSLRSYWKNYFESTDGIIWVIDSADVLRLNVGVEELKSVLHEEKLVGASVLILANKKDLPGAAPLEKIKEIFGMDEMGTHHWSIMSCSAMTGENVLHGIEWLVDDISSRIFNLE